MAKRVICQIEISAVIEPARAKDLDIVIKLQRFCLCYNGNAQILRHKLLNGILAVGKVSDLRGQVISGKKSGNLPIHREIRPIGYKRGTADALWGFG